MSLTPAADDPDVIVWDDTPVVVTPPAPPVTQPFGPGDPFASWYTDTAQVEKLDGYGPAGGQLFADPEPLACWAEDVTTLVRDEAGTEVQSTRTLHCSLADQGSINLGSRVTLNGLTSAVLGLTIAEYGWPTDGVTVRLS